MPRAFGVDLILFFFTLHIFYLNQSVSFFSFLCGSGFILEKKKSLGFKRGNKGMNNEREFQLTCFLKYLFHCFFSLLL